jgi:lipoprotein-releasing system permease protein
MHFKFAWRYFRAKKSTNAINIIAWVSVMAIIIGTASLIIILSAFNGFESLLKSLYSSFYTDIRIIPAKGKLMQLDSTRIASIRSFPGVSSACLVAEEKALLQNGELQTIVQIKGVDRNYPSVAGLPYKMLRGAFQTGTADEPRMVLGAGVENAIGVLSDRTLLPLTLYMPRKGMTDLSDPLGSLSQAQVLPVGSFSIQSDFDNKYVITNIDFLRQYLGFGAGDFTAVEISVMDPQQEENVRSGLQDLMGNGFQVQNRYQQNRNLYATIQLEKWAIYAIFSLILLVAAFNMIGALSMLVLEKKKDIQVLQAMGAGQGLIRRIFLSEGLLLALIGLAGGILLALLLYFLQVNYKLVPLQGQSFLIDYYPVKLVFWDFLLVASTVILIGILASWFPALRAARQPFELRN